MNLLIILSLLVFSFAILLIKFSLDFLNDLGMALIYWYRRFDFLLAHYFHLHLVDDEHVAG